MDSSYNLPQDDYSLSILTQGAMDTIQTDSPNSSLDPHPASSKDLTSRGIAAPITHHHHQSSAQNINQRTSQVSQRRTPDILDDYNPAVLSSYRMESLTYDPATAGRQLPYMNQAYQGIGSQISHNYANSLGILNAESYDDATGALRAREASEVRLKNNEPVMPFGITSGPQISLDLNPTSADNDELDAGSRRRKKPRIEIQSGDDEEEARKKGRGRPRVDTKDETAADRRRTQIRMAQRAYRHRKETTISSLEKRVQELKGTNEEMSKIFISLYDFAVGKSLLDREPEFARRLQSTTERFLALAKKSEDHDDNYDDDGEKHDDEGESGGSKAKGRRASTKKHQEIPPPAQEPTNTWGGYTLSIEESPIEEIGKEYQPGQQYRTRDDLQIITRPTYDNASFPFDLMDLQQYRVEVPQIEDYSQQFLPQSQLPLPSTHSHNEFSFARRIHRGAIEKALKLVTSVDRPEDHFQRVFGFSLLYETKEEIEARLRRLLNASRKETLQEWRAPFVHVGGSGTYYPMHDDDVSGDLMPKFRTGYSMGPFSTSVSEAQEVLDNDMKCKLPGFEGEFFDPNDVEGYLRGRGLDIPPAADFVSGEIDLLALTEMKSPKSYNSATATSSFSPGTPRSPIASMLLDGDNFDVGKNDGNMAPSKSANQITNMLPYPLPYDSWENNNWMDKSLIDPIFSTMPDQNMRRAKTPAVIISDSRVGEKRNVTISVKTLLDEILRRIVCLGRCPGFRPADVNAAILTAVKAGFESQLGDLLGGDPTY